MAAIAIPRLAGFTGSAAQKTILADIKTMETAAVAIVSEDDTLTFADLEVGTSTQFEDFLDDDIITRYTGATFDTDGRVNDIASIKVGGNEYSYTKSTKAVVEVTP